MSLDQHPAHANSQPGATTTADALFTHTDGDRKNSEGGQMSRNAPQHISRMPVRLERHDSNGQFRDNRGKIRPRTFTSRPCHGLPQTFTKADFTHNPARLVDIATETRSLVHRLESVYSRPVGQAIATKSPPRGKPCNEAPTSRNRKLFSERVAEENLRIYHRLQKIKPSRDTSSTHLRKEWQTAQKLAANISRTQTSSVRLRRRLGN